MGVLKDFDCSKVQHSKTVEGTTDYNIINPGVSYSGFCGNDKCVAYKKGVVCNRGYGSHLVNDDIMSGQVKCPKCSMEFPMRHVCLYRCKATVTILDHEEQQESYVVKGDDIVKLGSKKDEKINPHALMSIEATSTSRPDCAVM
eukprot:Sspe_Gene.84031::Locus_55162_Transcript_1_1_Confidence_1.000_Length_616::g.84031::m.84031